MEKTSCEAAIGDFFEGGGGTGTSVFVKWSYWKLLLSTLTYSKAPGSGCSEVRKQKGRVFEYRRLFSRASFFSISLYLSIRGVSLTRFLEEVQHYLFSIKKCMLGFAAGGEASLMCRE